MHRHPWRLAWLSLFLAISGSLGGCVPLPEDCALANIRCAGLVTDFGAVGEGLPRQAWLGLLDAQSSGLLDRVDSIETIDTRDRAANLSAFGDAGYDVIVVVGAGITDDTVHAAQQYPDQQFIGLQQSVDQDLQPPNLVELTFNEKQSGFLAGAAAGLMTRTRQVAAVCEVDFIDRIRAYCEGFRSGVAFVDPGIVADVIYRSGAEELLFHDVEWGRNAALSAVDKGADVVFSVGEETAAAALAAAADRGALVIGAEVDQYTELPEIRPQLLTSAVLDVRPGVLQLVRNTLEGTIQGGEYRGKVALAPFHEFEDRAAPDVFSRLQQIAKNLETGEIRIDASR